MRGATGSPHGLTNLLRPNEQNSAFQLGLFQSTGRWENSAQDWDNNLLDVSEDRRNIPRFAIALPKYSN